MWCKETSKKIVYIFSWNQFFTKIFVKMIFGVPCWCVSYNSCLLTIKKTTRNKPSSVRDAIKKNNDMIFVWLGDEQWWIFFQCQVKKWCIQNNINGIFFFIIITYTRIFLIQIIFVIKKKRRYYHSIKTKKKLCDEPVLCKLLQMLVLKTNYVLHRINCKPTVFMWGLFVYSFYLTMPYNSSPEKKTLSQILKTFVWKKKAAPCYQLLQLAIKSFLANILKAIETIHIIIIVKIAFAQRAATPFFNRKFKTFLHDF